MKVIDCTNTAQWQAVLERCAIYDFYHLPAYSALEAQLTNHEAKLFVFEEDSAIVAFPLILRSLTSVEGLDSSFTAYYDATSVYGYPGPITNQPWTNRPFFERFGNELQKQLGSMRVITAFSRLHPIIGNDEGLCVGRVIRLGETVSIDLGLQDENQFGFYRKTHRNEIRKARAQNVVCIHDLEWKHFEEFISLYRATMRRVKAGNNYQFDEGYFSRLRLALGKNLHLFAAMHNGKIVSAALFTIMNGLVQYHLSGSSNEELNFAASKLVIEEARQWASRQQATVLHLGGGLGSQEDSLFFFKAGFSPARHRYKLWQLIVDNDRYNLAVQQRHAWLTRHGLEFAGDEYFPIYRSGYRGASS